jgi:hypothetical protein
LGVDFYQIAPYSKSLIENGYPHKKIIILNLPKSEGDTFQVQQVSSDNLELEFEIFLNCLSIFNLQKEIKNKKKGGVI